MLPAAPSRRLFLAGLLSAAAAPAAAEAPARSPRPPRRPGAGANGAAASAARPAGGDLAALVAAAKLGGETGLAVLDARTGELLEALEPDRALPPASVLKAVTALYALDRLGPAHRWTTRVLAGGPVSGGTLDGDLILAGGGDPVLTTDELGDLAAAVAARGLKRVTGGFRVWAGALPELDLIDREQPVHAGYNPAVGGLNLNHNRVHFEWRRGGDGWRFSMDARGERFVPPVRMARVRAADRAAPVFTYRAGRDADEWTVAAGALGKGGARWLPVRHPARYAGEVFQTLLAAHGIRLPDPEPLRGPPRGTLIAEAGSPPLADVLRDMLKFSTNLTAEVVGLTASGAPGLAASGRAMADWARIRLGATGRFADHSGLGGDSRVSARDMARMLAAGRTGALPALLKNHGLRDAKGNEIAGSPLRVVAKTGTLNFVSGLAGFILPPAGRPLAFAIFSADVARRDRLGPEEREQPAGGQGWTRRARGLQNALVARWAAAFA
jgi:D-alanyl-D-alanine carboxypeptidase/D-alanyl-D-alanine-endopeptidase (penicillin-binding protein 4)